MYVRDDEDLAVDQLPALVAGAGRADDPDLRDARTLGPQPQEHAAERTQAPPTAGLAVRLSAIAQELQTLRAQLRSLPIEELRRLEHAQQHAARASEQRAAALQRLIELPVPRRRLARMHDPHAIERAQLHAAIDAATTQQAALERHQAQLRNQIGAVAELRAESDGLQRRVDQLQQARTALVDRAAQAELARQPAWATRTLGPLAVRSPARGLVGPHRDSDRPLPLEHDIHHHTDGIGPKPSDDAHRSRWRRVELQIARGRQELHQHDIGHDR